MSTFQNEITFEALVNRLAKLEEEHSCLKQANAHLTEQLAALRTEQPLTLEQTVTQVKNVVIPERSKSLRRQASSNKRRSRRGMLRNGLGAAAAIVGAGTLLHSHSGTVYANGNEGPTVFTAAGSQIAVTAQSASGSAVSATNYGKHPAVYASSDIGYGVTALSKSTTGVYAQSDSGAGIVTISKTGDGLYSSSDSSYGVFAKSNSGTGVYAQSSGQNAYQYALHAVTGTSSGSGPSAAAVYAEGGSGSGVYGTTTSLNTNDAGIVGNSDASSGVSGTSNSWAGVSGTSNSFAGVYGEDSSSNGIGVYGFSNGGSNNGKGVYGFSSGNGVYGFSPNGIGVHGGSTSGLAGQFDGNVSVSGSLNKGGGSFRIDHPLDPAHKYLFHSFVESPDMMNIYNGMVMLDAQGEAEVTLPSWFNALNFNFRYQLTAIGMAAPDLYIAEKISADRFMIAGGKPGMEVSWMVTGIRHDAWANAYRIPVEQNKPMKEQGIYLHPELYGESDLKDCQSETDEKVSHSI